jgi:hypothetical protein
MTKTVASKSTYTIVRQSGANCYFSNDEFHLNCNIKCYFWCHLTLEHLKCPLRPIIFTCILLKLSRITFKYYNDVQMKSINFQIDNPMMYVLSYLTKQHLLYKPNIMTMYTRPIRCLGIKPKWPKWHTILVLYLARQLKWYLPFLNHQLLWPPIF